MKGYLYLLESLDGKKYLGSSSDVFKRLDEHNEGQTTSTRGKGPWKIVKIWEFKTLVGSRKMEYKIKKTKKKLTIENIDCLIKWFYENY